MARLTRGEHVRYGGMPCGGVSAWGDVTQLNGGKLKRGAESLRAWGWCSRPDTRGVSEDSDSPGDGRLVRVPVAGPAIG